MLDNWRKHLKQLVSTFKRKPNPKVISVTDKAHCCHLFCHCTVFNCLLTWLVNRSATSWTQGGLCCRRARWENSSRTPHPTQSFTIKSAGLSTIATSHPVQPCDPVLSHRKCSRNWAYWCRDSGKTGLTTGMKQGRSGHIKAAGWCFPVFQFFCCQ